MSGRVGARGGHAHTLVYMAGEIIYGRNGVLEALRDRGRVNRVYLARDAKVASRDELLNAARSAGVAFEFIPLAKLNAITGTSEHQGCAAAVSPVAYVPLEEIVAALDVKALILVLDQVQHPRNVGMLLRAAAAAGASAVLLPQRGGAMVDQEIIRASAGAVWHIPLVACANLGQSLRELKEAGFWVYGLAASGAHDVFEMQWPARTVLVVGNESKGMRPGTAKLCDDLLSIPLARGIESLNVAVAAGIAMYQCMQARR